MYYHKSVHLVFGKTIHEYATYLLQTVLNYLVQLSVLLWQQTGSLVVDYDVNLGIGKEHKGSVKRNNVASAQLEKSLGVSCKQVIVQTDYALVRKWPVDCARQIEYWDLHHNIYCCLQ